MATRSTPQTKREQTHERIVEVAARALRRRGYDGVGVAEVMKEAGLTHGGFYAHFESREALLVEAMERASRDSAAQIDEAVAARAARGESPLRALIELYLADAHVASAELGCPVAALGSEMWRQSPALLAASAERVQGLIARVRALLPPEHAKEQAPALVASLVGALQMARTLGPNAQGRVVLAATRKSLFETYSL
jgi:AcrR family transcriptional regulator